MRENALDAMFNAMAIHTDSNVQKVLLDEFGHEVRITIR